MKKLRYIILSLALLFVTTACSNDGKSASAETKADQKQGETVYTQRCAPCHDRGLAGAPQTGKKEDWVAPLARGVDKLVEHSINGYRGQRGYMPPRGGHADLSDADVKSAVQFMITQSQ